LTLKLPTAPRFALSTRHKVLQNTDTTRKGERWRVSHVPPMKFLMTSSVRKTSTLFQLICLTLCSRAAKLIGSQARWRLSFMEHEILRLQTVRRGNYESSFPASTVQCGVRQFSAAAVTFH